MPRSVQYVFHFFCVFILQRKLFSFDLCILFVVSYSDVWTKRKGERKTKNYWHSWLWDDCETTRCQTIVFCTIIMCVVLMATGNLEQGDEVTSKNEKEEEKKLNELPHKLINKWNQCSSIAYQFHNYCWVFSTALLSSSLKLSHISVVYISSIWWHDRNGWE